MMAAAAAAIRDAERPLLYVGGGVGMVEHLQVGSQEPATVGGVAEKSCTSR